MYSKSKYSQIKSLNILLKSIAYFGAERVWLPLEKASVKKAICHKFPSVQFENGPYDILFINPFEAEKLVCVASKEKKIHNTTVLLIDGMYANNANIALWENIKNHRTVTVTVDMFYCGAVFFRKEQAKEHFKIRI